MTTWRILSGELIKLYSPIGLRLVDNMTKQAPVGRVTPMLELSDGSGGWREAGVKAVFTLSGVIAFPGLERRADVAGQPPRRYRVRLNAEFYRSMDPAGFEFDAYPYNDTNPPNGVAPQIKDALLSPAANYPFPAHIPVLRGVVVDQNNSTVIDATVSESTRESVFTDARGGFALPLRWVQKNVSIPINASDQRTGKAGFINIVIPTNLGINNIIHIN